MLKTNGSLSTNLPNCDGIIQQMLVYSNAIKTDNTFGVFYTTWDNYNSCVSSRKKNVNTITRLTLHFPDVKIIIINPVTKSSMYYTAVK